MACTLSPVTIQCMLIDDSFLSASGEGGHSNGSGGSRRIAASLTSYCGIRAGADDDLIVGFFFLSFGRACDGIDLGHLGDQLFVVRAVPWLVELELLVQFRLPDVRQNGDAPAQERSLAVLAVDSVRGQALGL